MLPVLLASGVCAIFEHPSLVKTLLKFSVDQRTHSSETALDWVLGNAGARCYSRNSVVRKSVMSLAAASDISTVQDIRCSNDAHHRDTSPARRLSLPPPDKKVVLNLVPPELVIFQILL